MTLRILRWTGLVLALLWPAVALAHATTTALARIELVDNKLRYALSIVLPEIPVELAEAVKSAANGDRAAAEKIAASVRQMLSVELGGARCRMGAMRIGGAGANDARGTIEIDFTCEASHGRLEIAEDWSALLGEHYQTLGNIKTSSGERQVSFREESRKVSVDIDRPVATGWLDFIMLGVEHIVTGYDHLLFLVALLATAKDFRSVVRIVTAFTVAHSVTLSLATFDIFTVPGRIIEPLIAASIVWVGLENFFPGAGPTAMDLGLRFRPCPRLWLCFRAGRTRSERTGDCARFSGLQLGYRDRTAALRCSVHARIDAAEARTRSFPHASDRIALSGHHRCLLADRAHVRMVRAMGR